MGSNSFYFLANWKVWGMAHVSPSLRGFQQGWTSIPIVICSGMPSTPQIRFLSCPSIYPMFSWIISKLNYFCIQIFTPVTSPHLLEELNQRLKPMLSTFKDPEVKISRVVCFHHPKCGALENSIFACFFQITHLLGLSKWQKIYISSIELKTVIIIIAIVKYWFRW